MIPPTHREMNELLASEYACTPMALSQKAREPRLQSVAYYAMERAKSEAWITAVHAAVFGGAEGVPDRNLVAIVLGFARGRVGGWMTPKAWTAAWAIFEAWDESVPARAVVGDAVWHKLTKEAVRISSEDHDNEFGTHVLSDRDLWNEFMPRMTRITSVCDRFDDVESSM